MLAKLHRAGELTAVWVPDVAHEAMRDLVRTRATAVRVTGKSNREGRCIGPHAGEADGIDVEDGVKACRDGAEQPGDAGDVGGLMAEVRDGISWQIQFDVEGGLGEDIGADGAGVRSSVGSCNSAEGLAIDPGDRAVCGIIRAGGITR
jgi:hypothetical protein